MGEHIKRSIIKCSYQSNGSFLSYLAGLMGLILQTTRLRVREFTPEDSEFILRLVNTSGWLQFIGDKNVHTEADALGYLSNGPLDSYRKFGFGMWHVSERDAGVPIGMCGLLKRPGLDHPDLGFAFMPEHHGNGYAYEAATGVLSYGFEVFQLETIFAITMESNVRAQALLKKVGMLYERNVLIAASGKEEELLLYSRRRQQTPQTAT